MSRPEMVPSVEGSVQTAKDVNNAIHGLLDRSRRVRITGLAGQTGLAVGLSGDYEINAVGNVGDYIGAFNEAAVIVLRGKCGGMAGDSMVSGGLVVEEDCGRDCGLRMRGGIIVVKGNAGPGPGRSMTGGTIIIAGDVKGDACQSMEGGTFIVVGNLLGKLGPISSNANVYMSGSIPSPVKGAQEAPLTEKDMIMLDKYFSHYMIQAVPRTFRKFKGTQDWTVSHTDEMTRKERTLPMVMDHASGLPDITTGLLDEIAFTTSDLEDVEHSEDPGHGLIVGKVGSTGQVNLDEPFLADIEMTGSPSTDLMLGMATACAINKWPISLEGNVRSEMRELFTTQRTRVIYRLGCNRTDVDMMMLKGASLLELSVLSRNGARLPELRNGKDLPDLMTMLRELRPGPIIIDLRSTSVDRDLETVLLSEPDSVNLKASTRCDHPAIIGQGTPPGDIVTALVGSNRHFETMGARRKGIKLIVSGGVRGPMDALKLLSLGADGVGVGDLLFREVVQDSSGAAELEGMDWSLVGDRTMEVIDSFRNGTKRLMTFLDLTSFSQLTPRRLVALTYNAASLTGLPLAGYGSVLPMWMQ